MKKRRKKNTSTLKKWNRIFCKGLTCKTNVRRDFLVILLVIVLVATALTTDYHISRIRNMKEKEVAQEKFEQQLLEKFEEENNVKVSSIQDEIDESSWKEYKSNWYGFTIKYPENWQAPRANQPRNTSSAEYRISFEAEKQENKNFVGFDVAIYDTKKTSEIFETDEFPKMREGLLKETNQCDPTKVHAIETGDYPAEQIYTTPKNLCYSPALFFSVTQGQYIYNITPVLKEGADFYGDPMIGVSDDLPEFFVAISQFENIDIVRPKPEPVKITAPFPVSYKVDELGRLVCAKKNDKPGKSKKNKKKHLDMQCCLDPDEYPNPHCYYPLDRYGKYL